MDLDIMLSIIAIVFSVVGGLSNYYYNQKNLDYMKKDLDYMKKEFDARSKEQSVKESLKNASNAVRIASNNIRNIYKDRAKESYFGLDLLTTPILTELHDKKLSRIDLVFSFSELQIMHGGPHKHLRTPIKSSQSLLDFIYSPERTSTYKKKYTINDLSEYSHTILSLDFDVVPKIFLDSSIDLRDLLFNWIVLTNEIKRLEEHFSIIEVYHPNIIEKMKEKLNEMIILVVDNMLTLSGKELYFLLDYTSDKIQKELADFILMFSTHEELFEDFITNCIILDNIQKEIFNKFAE